MFRFTIRELLILTVTAGLAVGWWLDHRALAPLAEAHRRFADGYDRAMHDGLKRLTQTHRITLSNLQEVSVEGEK